MCFNEHQTRLWRNMISLIEDFRKGKIQYSNVVYGLEGALNAGDFKDEILIKRWYDFWTPLEILFATKGDSTSIEDADKYLSAMKVFLKNRSDLT